MNQIKYKFFLNSESLFLCILILVIIGLEKFGFISSEFIIIYFLTIFPVIVFYKVQTNNKNNKIHELIESTEKFQNNVIGTNAQLFESCTQLNESIEEQSLAVISTSSSGDEISSMIDQSSENLKSVEGSIFEINNLVKNCQKSSEDLESSFANSFEENKNVITKFSSISKTLEGLTSLFETVTQKTELINDIVFQTKLLSFNASVEAARAGEHGKGFAVVAEEIGVLAKSSGESAKSINQTLLMTKKKIDEITSDISIYNNEVSQQMNETNKKNSTMLNDFKENYSKVIKMTHSIAEEVKHVSVASIEQSKGVNELRDSIHLISSSVQRNTLVVSQTTNLANMLNSYFLNLESILSTSKNSLNIHTHFKIESIPWKNEYLIGIKDMDDEHIIILDKINILIEKMNEENFDEIKKSFLDLEAYTIFHFDEEEVFLQKINYPSYESHKKVHENLLLAIKRYVDDIENGTLDKVKLASFLKNWLFTHIMGVDTKYAQHYKEEQITGGYPSAS